MDTQTYSDMIVIDALEADQWERETFEAWRDGGLTCVHATCMAFTFDNTRPAISALAQWDRLFHDHADLIMPALTVDDIHEAKSVGKTAVILGFQNTLPLEDELALVRVFHRLGIRVMQLTYNAQNLVGSGCQEPNDGGLSRFGRNVVHEMNELHMLIDLSHCGERTCLETIELSEQPVAVTHSNSASTAGTFELTHRLKSDRVIKALVERNGVIGMSTFPPMMPGGNDCTLDNWCEMAAHTVEVAGIDHVGIGTDFVWRRPLSYIKQVRTGRSTFATAPVVPPVFPDWIKTPADFPVLASGLSAHGFGDDEVRAIMGGNWLRLFAEVIGGEAHPSSVEAVSA
jgi:membrane dipeptidase